MAENLKYWRANWQRELERLFLYWELAPLGGTPENRSALAEMGEQEEHDGAVWAERTHLANPQVRQPGHLHRPPGHPQRM